MRNLLWIISLLFICNNSWADLGALKIDSYLNQPLYASIPVTGSNLVAPNLGVTVNLASSAKFAEYGLNYEYELGYLKFKIQRVNDDNLNVLITSSKPIVAPVLDLLLEYKAGNISYYRQYNVLLDPIRLHANYPPINSDVLNSKQDPNTSVKLKNIPYVTPNQPIIVNENKYSMDLLYPLIQSQIKNYQLASNIYITKDDSLYSVAKFMQGLYHNANLDISQFIFGIGLTNYQKLTLHNGALINGQNVKFPSISDIEKIDIVLANQYLLDTVLTPDQKTQILSAIAKKYDSSIIVVTPRMFKVEAKPIIRQISHENKESIFSRCMIALSNQDISWWILLVFCVGLLSFCYKMRKSKYKNGSFFAKNNSVVDTLLYQPIFAGEKINTAENIVEIDNIDVISNKLPENNIIKRDHDIDQELVQTLLEILTQDQTRNDIRVELLSVYAQAHNNEGTKNILLEIATHASNDYGLINKSIKIASHYGYESVAREVLLNPISHNIDEISVIAERSGVNYN